MDYISSVFQIDYNSTDDLVQYFSSFPSQKQTTPKDKVPLRPYEDCHDLANKTQHGRRRKSPIALGSVKDENPNDNKKKKIIHRDIERQRRQEMANLYGSLRCLLPLKYLKGKRSTSDHIHQTVNYIKHQEEKIQKLIDKKDELKRYLSTSSALENLEGCERDTLTVRTRCVGVEVDINTALKKGFPLSRVLAILIEEGFSVVSCISTKVNERMLHNIISEVTDGRSLDISELQQKLTSAIV